MGWDEGFPQRYSYPTILHQTIRAKCGSIVVIKRECGYSGPDPSLRSSAKNPIILGACEKSATESSPDKNAYTTLGIQC